MELAGEGSTILGSDQEAVKLFHRGFGRGFSRMNADQEPKLRMVQEVQSSSDFVRKMVRPVLAKQKPDR
jgi:hypothetical protein